MYVSVSVCMHEYNMYVSVCVCVRVYACMCVRFHKQSCRSGIKFHITIGHSTVLAKVK